MAPEREPKRRISKKTTTIIISSGRLSLSTDVNRRLPAVYRGLERAFPANHMVELEVFRARGKALHARILQGVLGGVVDFYVSATSDPYKAGSGGAYPSLFVNSSGGPIRSWIHTICLKPIWKADKINNTREESW